MTHLLNVSNRNWLYLNVLEIKGKLSGLIMYLGSFRWPCKSINKLPKNILCTQDSVIIPVIKSLTKTSNRTLPIKTRKRFKHTQAPLKISFEYDLSRGERPTNPRNKLKSAHSSSIKRARFHQYNLLFVVFTQKRPPWLASWVRARPGTDYT